MLCKHAENAEKTSNCHFETLGNTLYIPGPKLEGLPYL